MVELDGRQGLLLQAQPTAPPCSGSGTMAIPAPPASAAEGAIGLNGYREPDCARAASGRLFCFWCAECDALPQHAAWKEDAASKL